MLQAAVQCVRSLSYLWLVNTSPLFRIRKKQLVVVASWKYDFFSFGKNVSGTQMCLMYSMPTVRALTPTFSNRRRGSVQICRR